MQWYKHDADASSDAKIRKLLLRYGPVGYAVYFHCLELIAGDVDQNNITFELEHDAEIIADNLKVRGASDQSAVDIVNSVMRYIVDLGLFEERGNRIFGFKLIKRLDKSMTGNPKFRELIEKAKENHDSVMMNADSVMTDHDPIMTDHDSVMLDKTRLEETRKEQSQRGDEPKADLGELGDVYLKIIGSPIPPGDYDLGRFLTERHSIDVIRYELERAHGKRSPLRYIHAYMSKPDYSPPEEEVATAKRAAKREEFVETPIDEDMLELARRANEDSGVEVEVW